MDKTYFTGAEARTEVGRVVEAVSDFPSVPKGSRGRVVKVTRYAEGKCAALVQWDLPRPSSLVLAMVLDTSFNFLKRSQPLTDEFTKSEYEILLRVLHPAN